MIQNRKRTRTNDFLYYDIWERKHLGFDKGQIQHMLSVVSYLLYLYWLI